MIHVEKPVKLAKDEPASEYLKGCHTLKAKIECLIDIVKTMPINGCITGSCFLPGFDPDAWGSTPDVDVFVYSEADLMKAIDYTMYQLKMKPGTGTDRSEQQERWKLDRLQKFYRYGLSQAGWNRYSYINVEFDNQIICKKRKK